VISFENRDLTDAIIIKVVSYWCPCKKRGHTGMMKTDTRVMQLQTSKCQGLSVATRIKGEARRTLPTACGGSLALPTPRFPIPEKPREKAVLCHWVCGTLLPSPYKLIYVYLGKEECKQVKARQGQHHWQVELWMKVEKG
jgi:hypothetical protein